MKTNIFSVTVALEDDGGFFWTALPQHQNIQFTEVLSVCQHFKFWKVSMFIESSDSWVEIGVSE